MKRELLLTVAMVAALTGCGTMPADRALSGAGIGAGAGAIVGAITGLTVLEGAALGAVAGGLTGVLTNKGNVDLGDPPWKQGAAQPRGGGGGYDPAVAALQSRLNALGYDAGRVDGRMGPRTQRAILAYQRSNGLPADGRPTQALAAHIGAP
jgi:hypothetical protein